LISSNNRFKLHLEEVIFTDLLSSYFLSVKMPLDYKNIKYEYNFITIYYIGTKDIYTIYPLKIDMISL